MAAQQSPEGATRYHAGVQPSQQSPHWASPPHALCVIARNEAIQKDKLQPWIASSFLLAMTRSGSPAQSDTTKKPPQKGWFLSFGRFVETRHGTSLQYKAAKKPPGKAAGRSLRQCAPPANFFARLASDGTKVSPTTRNAQHGHSDRSRARCCQRGRSPNRGRSTMRRAGCSC